MGVNDQDWYGRLCRELDSLKANDPNSFKTAAGKLEITTAQFKAIASGAKEPSVGELRDVIEKFGLSTDYILNGLVNAPALNEEDRNRWKTLEDQLRQTPAVPLAPQNDILCDGAIRVLEELADGGYTIILGDVGSKECSIATSYPEKWRDHYLSERLFEVDPVISWSLDNFGYCQWKDLPVTRAGQAFMKDAAEAGLANGTVVVSHALGKKCFVSLAHSKPELTEQEINVVRSALGVIATISQNSTKLPLTPISIALADYLASGMSDQGIADAMGVSDRTVRSRKKALVKQAGSRTITEAVCRSSAWRFG